MQISFDTDDVRVNEDNGTVFVCLEKDRQTLLDIELQVTAREQNPPDARCESFAYEIIFYTFSYTCTIISPLIEIIYLE